MPINLPPRLRESSFRIYEAVIAQAVFAHPDNLLIPVESIDVSPVTYAARLRDAMLSFSIHRWQSRIDFYRFSDLYHKHQLPVRHDGDTIRIGKAPKVVTPSMPTTSVAQPDAFVVANRGEATVVCRLAAARLLAGPIIVKGLSIEDVQFLVNHHDVAIKQDGDKCTII